ncbi:MAG TPA: NUDIX hydrolase [Candidatus Mcinerneyibacterium sp.]|nr:NUDIX hydrolase [Candidatus Mcinerneyibacterium sp.]
MGKSISEHPNPCPVCGRYLNRPGVVDGIVEKNGKIILIKRGRTPYKGYYAIPGGFIDWDETAKEAVVRELKEETNLNIHVKDFLNYYDSIKRDKRRRTISLVFVCELIDGKKARAGDDASSYRWFNIDELPELAFDHEQILNDYKKYREGNL